MVSIASKPPTIAPTTTTAKASPTKPSAATPAVETKGWAPRAGVAARAPETTARVATASTAQVSTSTSARPAAPLAGGARALVAAMANGGDSVSTSVAVVKAADQLIQGSLDVLTAQLTRRGDLAGAVQLRKEFAALPRPVEDRKEPLETAQLNGAAYNDRMGLLAKLGSAMARGMGPSDSPMAVAENSQAALMQAEVDFATTLKTVFDKADGDPAILERAQKFLDGLPAKVGNPDGGVVGRNDATRRALNSFAVELAS